MEVIKIKGNHLIDPSISKLRVAAYVRVSTKLELQQNSYESQIKYYESKINKNENWTLVNIYADYGVSGRNSSSRNNFIKMIKDSMSGKIDYILTKSISRFARNTVDTLKYVRLLKEKGIGIFFEEEGIYTLSGTTELLLTVLSSVAQQESDNLSSHIKLGKEMKILEGITARNKRPFGYNYNRKTNKYTINKYESNIVIEIFKKYLETESVAETIKYLISKKYKNYNRKTNWSNVTVYQILTNQRYIGIMESKKNIRKKIGSKILTKNNGIENKYIIYDFNPKIIDEEVFYQTQELLESNKKIKQRLKINNYEARCGFCGSSLTVVKTNTPKERLKCLHSVKGQCSESRLISISLIKQVLIECLTRYLKSNEPNNRNDSLNYKLKIKEKEIAIRRKGINVDLLLNKRISKGDYIERNKSLDERINLINKELDDYTDKIKKTNINKEKEIEFYNSIIDKMNSKLSLYTLLEKLELTLIVGGYDEKGNIKQNNIRFIRYKPLHQLNRFKKIELYKKLADNNTNEFSYSVLLDYKSKYIRKIRKQTSKGDRVLNKRIRVRLEIVEEK